MKRVINTPKKMLNIFEALKDHTAVAVYRVDLQRALKVPRAKLQPQFIDMIWKITLQSDFFGEDFYDFRTNCYFGEEKKIFL